MWQAGIKLTDGNKVANRFPLRWEDFPGVSGASMQPQESLKDRTRRKKVRVKRFEDATLLDLKIQEGAMNQGMQVVSRS